tara:strand:- start:672 stop:1046 length:375 start_codon:yes stop_codon:yes gene_type:complete
MRGAGGMHICNFTQKWFLDWIVERSHFMKVLSIIRFKPKTNHLEDVIENLKSHNKKVRKLLNQKRFLSEIDGEVYLVKVSDTIDDIAEDQTLSLDALDGIRDWLEEWSEEERHTRSVSGLLIDE